MRAGPNSLLGHAPGGLAMGVGQDHDRDLGGFGDPAAGLRVAELVYETVSEGVIVTDRDGVILAANPAARSITGLDEGELVGHHIQRIRSERHPARFFREMALQLRREGSWDGEIWTRHAGGPDRPMQVTIRTASVDGADDRVVCVLRDVTELRRHEEALAFQAQHDALTGLPNRLLLRDRLERAVAHAQRNGLRVAVMKLDLDHFQNLNDTIGHGAADRLLLEVARRLRDLVRREDTIARTGGDEFTLVIEEVAHEEAAVMAAGRIMEAFDRPFPVHDPAHHASASIGISLYPDDADQPDDLLRNADVAMHRAKQLGANQIVVFREDMNRQIFRRMEMEGGLRRALERGELEVYFQPRICTTSCAIVGMEALVRWNKPGEGMVRPHEFIPLAEETGLVVPLGEQVLEQACRRLRRWQQGGREDLRLSVNLSGRQVQETNLVERVVQILDDTGLPPTSLELEITETAIMHNLERGMDTLWELAGFGIEISIDDFGTGYSSLHYLKSFPIETIKIDRSFVRDLHRDPSDAAIVSTIVDLAERLGLKVIAEGVETAQQLAFFRKLRCSEIQGFLFSPPLPEQEFDRLLRDGFPAELMRRVRAEA